MPYLCLWAAGTDLPVKILAAVGACAVGGLLGGWALALAAKFAFNQKVPNWLAWIVRLLSGFIVGYLAWMMLGGNFGFGLGNGTGGSGGGDGKGARAEKRDDTAKPDNPDKKPKPTPPEEKRPDDKGKSVGPGIGSGESIRVEILGNDPLEKLAKGGKVDLERRYRIIDAPATLRTLAELEQMILDRRKQAPPLRKLDVVVYADSPAPDSPPVKEFIDWAKDLDPGEVGRLEVGTEYPDRPAPSR